MAHLEDDRGQIILIAAFALAVTFVALALVVNSSIFTENLATRGDPTGGSDALEYRHEVEQNAGRVVEYVNRHNVSNRVPAAKDALRNVSDQGGLQNSMRGRVVNVSVRTTNGGSRLFQRDSSDQGFLDASNNENWTLATSVRGTRAVRINVTDKSVLATDRDGAFHLVVDGMSDDWHMTVYKDSPGSDDMKVSVTTGNGDTATCSRTVADSHFEVDVTGGRFAGEPCHALTVSDGDRMWFGEGVSVPYTLKYTNGTRIAGNYSMVVDGTSDPASFNSTSDPPPHATGAIYSLDVRYTFETADVTYETVVRVAPGETDD